jgi:hypothetical protein
MEKQIKDDYKLEFIFENDDVAVFAVYKNGLFLKMNVVDKTLI